MDRLSPLDALFLSRDTPNEPRQIASLIILEPDGSPLTFDGLIKALNERLDIVPRYLITGRRVAGSSFGGIKGRDEVPRLVDLWLEGKLDVDPFLSHTLTLDDVNRGFELMHAQDGIRSVISFS